MAPIIQAENISKKYLIGHQVRESYSTLRDRIGNMCRSFGRNQKGHYGEEFWALKDISFEINQGESVGIIGRNGAGKSTLLKILSRITAPTSGRVTLKGRVASLLEVGTGFHPELTGRENIFLNGAILGMLKADIRKKFDEIVAFSEVEKFLDTPVKRYSSGMYVRLAFAVAAHLEPEILLVDEVLAVGDIQFQKKCLGRMDDVSRQGRTVLFVSHNMGAIRSLCARGILLDNGSIKCAGDTFKVVAEYENQAIIASDAVWINSSEIEKNETMYIEKIEIVDENGVLKNTFFNSENVYLKYTLHVRQSHPDLKVGFDLVKSNATVFRSQQVDSVRRVGTIPEGVHRLICKVPAFLLNAGDYAVVPIMSIHCIRTLINDWTPVLRVRINIDPSGSDFHVILDDRNHPGGVFPMLDWELT